MASSPSRLSSPRAQRGALRFPFQSLSELHSAATSRLRSANTFPAKRQRFTSLCVSSQRRGRRTMNHIHTLHVCSLKASVFLLLNIYVGMFPSDRNRRQIDKSLGMIGQQALERMHALNSAEYFISSGCMAAALHCSSVLLQDRAQQAHTGWQW